MNAAKPRRWSRPSTYDTLRLLAALELVGAWATGGAYRRPGRVDRARSEWFQPDGQLLWLIELAEQDQVGTAGYRRGRGVARRDVVRRAGTGRGDERVCRPDLRNTATVFVYNEAVTRAAAASTLSPFWVYYNSQWLLYGCTSFSSPVWAGLVTTIISYPALRPAQDADRPGGLRSETSSVRRSSSRPSLP
jgi:hypothetical protein